MDCFTWGVSAGSWESFCFSIPSHTFDSGYFLCPQVAFLPAPWLSFRHLLCLIWMKSEPLVLLSFLLCAGYCALSLTLITWLWWIPRRPVFISPLHWASQDWRLLRHLSCGDFLSSCFQSHAPFSLCLPVIFILLQNSEVLLIFLNYFTQVIFFFVFKIGLFLLICLWIQGSTVLSCQVCHWVFLTDFFFNFSPCIFLIPKF